MTAKSPPRHSLKARITLATLLIFLGGTWSLWLFVSQSLRLDMEGLLGDKQYATVSMVAAHIDDELSLRLKSLESVAGTSAQALRDGPKAIQAHIEQDPSLQKLFNAGVIAHRRDGTVVANFPLILGQLGTNQMNRDFVAAALARNTSAIGRPVLAKDVLSPVVGMAVPIRDAQGHAIGSLAGEINLSIPNFLDQITDSRYGRTGGYLVVAPHYRLVVAATDKRRILEQLPAPGVNPVIDRFIQGYEGYAVLTNPLGVEVLAAARRIPVAAWYVAAAVPTEEVFAPIRAMQQRILIATVLLTLLAGGLTWWALRRQLAPMTTAANTLAFMSEAPQTLRPLPINRDDEIGELVGSFNRLLETLRTREAALKNSEEELREANLALQRAEDELRRFFNLIPDPLCIASTDGHFLKINAAWTTIFGYSEAEILATPFIDFIHPEDRDATLAEVTRQIEGQTTLHFVNRYRCKNGNYRWLEWQATAAVDNSLLFASARDITERTLADQELRDSEARMHAIIDNTLYAAVGIDAEGRITEWNLRAETVFGWTKSQALGLVLDSTIIPDRYREDHRQGLARFLSTGATRLLNRRIEISAMRRNGEEFPIELAITPLKSGDSFYFTAFITDITERKQAETNLRIAAAAFESDEGMVITDDRKIILRSNLAFSRITGYTSEELIGRDMNLLKSDRHDSAFFDAMWHAIVNHGTWQGEIWNRIKSGEVRPHWLTISTVRGSDGVITHYVGAYTDITERKLMEEQIRQMAFYDPLTRLANRRLLHDRLDQTMAASKRNACHGALMFLDLDNFKPLNDAHGHNIGDLLLIEVANRLKSHVREIDTVARFGGDEFVVLISELEKDKAKSTHEAALIAEKIRATLAEPYLLSIPHEQTGTATVEHHCTATIGVTVFIGNEASHDEILKWADAAMYQAKEAGGNLIQFYSPEPD